MEPIPTRPPDPNEADLLIDALLTEAGDAAAYEPARVLRNHLSHILEDVNSVSTRRPKGDYLAAARRWLRDGIRNNSLYPCPHGQSPRGCPAHKERSS